VEYLDYVGFACPRSPTEQEVSQEYERIWLQLGMGFSARADNRDNRSSAAFN